MPKNKILIVEDESSLQESLTEFLSMKGFAILNALDGEAGIALAIKENPDLILLDVILPKKNGYEVLEAIKKDKEAKNIPVILLTNLESSEDISKAMGMGVQAYLVKSNYTLENIAEKIEETLKNA